MVLTTAQGPGCSRVALRPARPFQPDTARATHASDPVTLDAVLAFCALCLLRELAPGPNTFLVLRNNSPGARTGVRTAAGSVVGARGRAVSTSSSQG